MTHFTVSQAPITAVLLVEFASTNYLFMRQALQASYAFANSLKKDDWVAVAYYDMQPHILVDFTQDKRAVYGALNQLRIPGFSETNLFDALYDTLDRLDRVEGKKYVILVTTGIDSFSKLTLDKIMKKIKDTKDVTIFPISVGLMVREYCETHPGDCRNAHGIGIPVGQHGLSARRQRDANFRGHDRRSRLLPALRGRVRRRISSIFRTTFATQYTLVLCSHEFEAGWNLSETQSAGGRA